MNKIVIIFGFLYRYFCAKAPNIGMKLNNKRYCDYDQIDIYRIKIIMEIGRILNEKK